MYEYNILQGDTLVNAKQLNDLAKDGWRLIEIVQHNGRFYFYLERLVVQ